MSEISPDPHPEHGFLLRLRSWRDALPWLAVVDCLRPAASVISLGLVGAAVALCFAAANALSHWMPVSNLAADYPPVFGELPKWVQHAVRMVFGPTMDLFQLRRIELETALALLLHQLLLLAIWAIPAAYLMRQSGLAMAGRTTMGTREGLALAARRIGALLIAPLIPAAILALIFVYFALASWIGQIPAIGVPSQVVLQTIGIPLAIVAGLVGFAGLFATPLAWAAIALEQEGNAFDGVSRGYEYVLRRPLQGAFYVAIGVLVVVVLATLAEGIARVGLAVAISGSGVADEAARDPSGVLTTVLLNLPLVAVLTVGWSLVAWIYLLLRRSANHQEIEDVWEHPRPAAEPIPELKREE